VTHPEATEEELLLLWRALPSAEARQRVTMAVVEEIGNPQPSPEEPPKKRGPPPTAPAKARQIRKRWLAYPAARKRGSISAHGVKFLKTLPEGLRPKNTKREGAPSTSNLSRLIKMGSDSNRARITPLRRLVAALRTIERSALAARGSRKSQRAGRPHVPEDSAELERLASEHEQMPDSAAYKFYLDRASRALLGDDAVDAQSYVRMPPQK
jgi:hypothetical protein